MSKKKLTRTGSKEQYESIRFSKSGITLELYTIFGTDEATDMILAYIPSLDISGYGDTQEEVQELLDAGVENYIDHFTSVAAMKRDLSEKGWKARPHKSKEYSKSAVNNSGELEGFIPIRSEKVEYELQDA